MLDHFLHKTATAGGSIVIIGYSDSIGTAAYNRQLSFFRARSVSLYAKKIISLSSVLISRGEDQLIPGGDSLNRRVQLIVRHFADITMQALRKAVPDPPDRQISPVAPVQPDTSINLAINFVENSPVLAPESRMAVPGYIRSLRKYKSRYLEIDGYCNSPGALIKPEDPLFKLSILRAKTIYDYFVDDGFDSTRLSYKGMGNASPVYPTPTDLRQA